MRGLPGMDPRASVLSGIHISKQSALSLTDFFPPTPTLPSPSPPPPSPTRYYYSNCNVENAHQGRCFDGKKSEAKEETESPSADRETEEILGTYM